MDPIKDISLLEQLPRELRDEIWAFALSRDEYIVIYESGLYDIPVSHQDTPCHPAPLTQVSRSIRAEALPIFYTANDFTIGLWDICNDDLDLFMSQEGTAKLLECLHSFLRQTPLDCRTKIRSLTVDLGVWSLEGSAARRSRDIEKLGRQIPEELLRVTAKFGVPRQALIVEVDITPTVSHTAIDSQTCVYAPEEIDLDLEPDLRFRFHMGRLLEMASHVNEVVDQMMAFVASHPADCGTEGECFVGSCQQRILEDLEETRACLIRIAEQWVHE